MFENFNNLVKEVDKMEPPAKKDLSIKLSQVEKIEIDKSLGEYKPEPKKIAGWGFEWR